MRTLVSRAWVRRKLLEAHEPAVSPLACSPNAAAEIGLLQRRQKANRSARAHTAVRRAGRNPDNLRGEVDDEALS